LGFGVLLAVSLLCAALPAAAQLQWSSKDGSQSFKIGLLGQPQAEWADIAGSKDSADNLFLRRIRLLMGFTLSDKLSVFVETDSPNLGKATAGVKDAGTIFIQDFVATYKFSQAFMVDGGMLLVDDTYNHMQSAATLLPLDYGPYTFNEGASLGERVGRDYGARIRGYLDNDHLEYRVGVLQGVRGLTASNDFEYTGRLMYSFFTPPVGLFYRGTSLGKTQTLSIGASYDAQKQYDNVGADLFWDQPLAGGNGFTLQADYNQIDGSTFIPTLLKQTNELVEAGFYIAPAKIQPFVQWASEDFKDPTKIDETRTSIGIAYYMAGHNDNVKFSYTNIQPKHGDSRHTINIQWQVFQF
jgi:hypothetical protein